MAADPLDELRQQRSLQAAAWAHSTPAVAVAGANTPRIAAATTNTATVAGVPGDPASWRTEEFNADWSKAAIGAEYAYALGYSGAGVKVGVLDSGVDADRWREREFGDRLHLVDTREAMKVPSDAGVYEFGKFDGRTSIGNYDESWHGTHVAGIIGASRNDQGTHGVAWGADIFSASHYLAGGTGGYGYSRIIDYMFGKGEGKRELIQLPAEAPAYQGLMAQGVRIINNSWGGEWPELSGGGDPLYNRDAEDYISKLNEIYTGADADVLEVYRSASAAGIVSIFSAGNSSDAAQGKVIHATPTASLPMAFPELESTWLAVAALGEDGKLAEFSQACGNARYWCVSAPGVDVRSTGAKRIISRENATALIESMRSYFPENVDLYSQSSREGFLFQPGNPLIKSLNPLESDDPVTAARLLAMHAVLVALESPTFLELDDPEGNRLKDDSTLFNLVEGLVINLLDAAIRARNPGDSSDVEYMLERSEFARAFADEYYRIIGEYSEVDSGGYLYSNGTSMAAPVVSGALALVMERFKYLSGEQARDVILTTSQDIGEPGVDEEHGWGEPDMKAAMNGPGGLLRDWRVDLQGESDVWSNDLVNGVVLSARESDRGRLILSGAGQLELRGNNSIEGFQVSKGVLTLSAENQVASTTLVDGGVLNINTTGTLSGADLQVDSGSSVVNGTMTGNTLIGAQGRLSGAGTLAGDVRVEGIVEPGNSVGTLTIDGNYVQTATGVYAAELASGERSDLLRVTGTATLDGTLAALPEPGVYYLGEQFNVLQADGGVQGQFAKTDFSAFSPFLQFSVAYAANGARIDVARGALLASAASTPNQRAVAEVADALAINQGLPRPLTQLFPQQAGAALDGLSGELHASTVSVLVENSRYVRDVALSRTNAGLAPGEGQSSGTGAWVQALGGNGKLDGDGNASRTESNVTGLLVGLDHGVGGWQLGVLGGTGRTDLKQAQGRQARSKITNTHLGLYAGHTWGGFGLRGGLAFSRHKINSTREVAFAGFSDTLSARYDANSRQAFIEAGYRFGDRESGLEPYLQVAQVQVDMDEVREQGGAAALRGQAEDTRTTVATAGLRFDKGLKAAFQQDSWLHVRGGVGYRRSFGDRNPLAQLAFDAGDAFTISGAPVADRTVVAELGLSAWLTARQQLELGYSGQFGEDSRDHSVNARWSVQF